ncbi:MAG TPA: 4-hydroxy-tetrahydrodipicolinate synthase [Desulfobacteraceae bacterium]|nr:4-hydroxy-tetrahydrodipicolinate synthase [Deltaproteobacteria bacterium]HDM09974.1 4-hydroxy-tetrahydrodipicolinate synthase [Desulfobacteraceae bacterium]
MGKLRGVFTVMATPFNPEGDIDEQGFRANIDWYIQEGVHGVICLGSTGEFTSLSLKEQKRVIDLTVEQVNGRVPVIAGTAANSTRQAIEMTRYAKDAGANAAIIVTPFYGMPTQEDLYEHYKAISESVDIPIMLYNNPWYSGVDLLASTVEKLSEFKNIQYIKESTGDVKRIHEIMHGCGNNIDVWCGCDDLIYESVLLGCSGWVAPIANFMPRESVELFNLLDSGQLDKAREAFFKMLPLLSYLEEGQLISKVKAAMNQIGLAGGYPRKPLLPLNEQEKTALNNMLAGFGLV